MKYSGSKFERFKKMVAIGLLSGAILASSGINHEAYAHEDTKNNQIELDLGGIDIDGNYNPNIVSIDSSRTEEALNVLDTIDYMNIDDERVTANEEGKSFRDSLKVNKEDLLPINKDNTAKNKQLEKEDELSK